MKDKTKSEEWAINKLQMTQVNKESNESTTTPPAENDKKEKSIGWAGVHVLFLQEERDTEFAK